MFTPRWTRIGRSGNSSRRSLRRALNSPWVRLHIERLEDRRFMNGDDPIAAAENLAANSVTFESLSLDSAAATYSAPVSSSASSKSSQPGRFQSTAEFEAWLIEATIAQYGELFGQTTYSYGGYDYGWYGGEIFTTGQPIVMPLMMRAATNDATLSLSSTNVQVEGVDEADIIETDGEYLYIISGQDLVIVRAGVGDELRVVSRLHLDERPAGMYLSGDRLALVSSSQSYWNHWEVGIFDWHAGSQFEPPTTTVTVLDITDRATPALVQKSELDGQLVTSRVVDGQLRLVLSSQLQLPQPIAKPIYTAREAEVAPLDSSAIYPEMSLGFTIWPSRWYGYGGVESVYESQEEYVARLRDEYLSSALPRLRILNADGSVTSESTLVEATDLDRPESHVLGHMTTIVTFDLASDEAGPVDTLSVNTGSTPQVYSTPDSVYIFAQQPWDWQNSVGEWTSKTNVWKFSLHHDTHEISLSAKGEFDGTLLNQFAADEHEGYLRVVTQPSTWGAGHNLHVLGQTGDELDVIATIGGIAPGERLHSVRFMGDRGFLVTFQQVDPLFALDLSDPTDPKLLGELVIPGVSGYLQPLDENHILGVGRGTDESGRIFDDLEVSIFEVSNLNDPQLLHRYSFEGGRSTLTPILNSWGVPLTGDHHAVSYFADEQILAIPIFTADGFGGFWGGIEDTDMFEVGYGGLQVFKIDVGAGFTPIGLIEHDTLIERSVQIGEHLFAISNGTVTVHELIDPSIELGEVSIAADPNEASIEPLVFKPLAQLDVIDVPEEKRTEAPATEPIDQIQQVALLIPESATPLPIEPPVFVEMVGTVAASVTEPPKSDTIERSLSDSGNEIIATLSRRSLPDVEVPDEIVSSEVDSKVRQIIQTDISHANAESPGRRLGKLRHAGRLQQDVDVFMAL